MNNKKIEYIHADNKSIQEITNFVKKSTLNQ